MRHDLDPRLSPRPGRLDRRRSESATASGLISTSQMTVRVVVVDRCTVGSAGVNCEGAAPIRPLAVSQVRSTPRLDILF